MRLTGAFFDLTDRVSGRPGGRPAGAVPAKGRLVDGRRSQLLISIAKRLVPSAVRRNTVKRVVREAWRAAIRDAALRYGTCYPTPPGTDNGIAEKRLQAGGRRSGGIAGLVPSRSCLVRLKRLPGSGVEPTPGLAVIKRSLRKDADALFAAYLGGSGGSAGRGATSSRRRPAAAAGDCSPPPPPAPPGSAVATSGK